MRIAIFSILGVIFYLLIYRYVEFLVNEWRLKKKIKELDIAFDEFIQERGAPDHKPITQEQLSRINHSGYKYPPYVDPILAQKQMREMSEEYYRRTGINPSFWAPTVNTFELNNNTAIGFNALYIEPEENQENPREEKLVNPPLELAGPDNKGTE